MQNRLCIAAIGSNLQDMGNTETKQTDKARTLTELLFSSDAEHPVFLFCRLLRDHIPSALLSPTARLSILGCNGPRHDGRPIPISP
jgi:hypothetical protein